MDDWQAKIVEVARSIVAGDVDFLVGIRDLNQLRMDSPDAEDHIFNLIRGIDSETDGVPYPERRNLYSKEYLARVDASMADYLPRVRAAALDHCKRIIEKYV